MFEGKLKYKPGDFVEDVGGETICILEVDSGGRYPYTVAFKRANGWYGVGALPRATVEGDGPYCFNVCANFKRK
jgi:hypothetical protein